MSSVKLDARIKNELRRIRSKIDKTRNPRKKAKMIKAYLEMLKRLDVCV